MSRDLREFSRQTKVRLLTGFILILLIGGSSLVYLIFGPLALPTYLGCIAAGLAPLLLIWIALEFLGWIVKRFDR